jgi:hypothetical protein
MIILTKEENKIAKISYQAEPLKSVDIYSSREMKQKFHLTIKVTDP